MRRIESIATKLNYSFPVRLAIRQFEGHKTSLSLWLIILAISMGWLGNGFGAQHLFLEPEYLGNENFWSHFFVGGALGAFIFAYMVSIYINESYRFPFIVYQQRPFFVFTFNNLLVPLTFLSIFWIRYFQYQWLAGDGFSVSLIEKSGGMFFGLMLMFLISSSFFFARNSLFQVVGEKLEEGLVGKDNKRNRWVILGRARESLRNPERVDHYLLPFLRWKKPGDWQRVDFRYLIRVLNQNHGKILLLQLLVFGFFAFLGLMEEKPLFQIPAGASLLLMMAFAMLIIGALSFWFRRGGFLAFLVVAGGLLLYSKMDGLREKNQAFGMDYSVEPANYSRENLALLTSEANYKTDRAQTLAALEAWKTRYQRKYGSHAKPKAVLVYASGGGMRSAFWTFRVMQKIDSLTEGKLPDQVRMMSGASGGMFGLSYFRELYLRQQLEEGVNPADPAYANHLSKDMLNHIFFKMFTDLLMPNRTTQVGSHRYDRETGYSFDQQLVANMPEFANRRLADYAPYEQQGIIPQLVLTPTIINQGRKLFISSSPVSYLTRPNQISEGYASKVEGVEFRRLFADQGADSLLMSTALRMNATFPVVLPLVELPSEPVMSVMDAGAIDNYGTQTAVRYLYEFRDWFAQNTSGVVIIQIRDNVREDPIRYASGDFPMIDRLSLPLRGGYYSNIEAKDMSNDYLLEFVQSWFKSDIEVLSFEYQRETTREPASLSWHLTAREKRNIEQSMNASLNQQSLANLQEIFHPGMLAAHKKP